MLEGRSCTQWLLFRKAIELTRKDRDVLSRFEEYCM